MKDSRMAVSRLALGSALSLSLAVSMTPTAVGAQSVDLSKWSPEYVRSIAGTETVDTAADCAKVTPLDYKGRVSVWWTGPTDASPDIDRKVHEEFWAAWKATYPNIETDVPEHRLQPAARQAPHRDARQRRARWWSGCRSSAASSSPSKGYFQELKPEDVGYPTADFWPGAMKSVTYDGKPYGIPTNNETMALIWNADIFERRRARSRRTPPATWDDVVAYSKTDQGQARHRRLRPGRQAERRQHAVPLHAAALGLWRRRARRGGRRRRPTRTVWINNEGAKAALQASYDMYVRDKSVPTSALTNTQTENQAPFIAGQLAMMIAHPAEYAKMVDLASKATGADKEVADEVVANMRYGLIPEGPARRAVVFGGSNIHIFKDEYVDGGLDEPAAKALDLLLDQPGMVDQARLGRLEPRQPARLQDRVDEGAPRHHQVPRRDDLDAAERHPVPGGAGSDRRS